MIDLPKGVWIPKITRDKLDEWWEKLKDFDKIFTDHNMLDVEAFYWNCLNSNRPGTKNWILETETGLVGFDYVENGLKARAHLSFWDCKLSSKTEMLRGILVWLFLTEDLHRVWAEIPVNARALRRFLVNKLNFKHEGTLRNDWLHKGQLIDRDVFSIIRTEVLDGKK